MKMRKCRRLWTNTYLQEKARTIHKGLNQHRRTAMTWLIAQARKEAHATLLRTVCRLRTKSLALLSKRSQSFSAGCKITFQCRTTRRCMRPTSVTACWADEKEVQAHLSQASMPQSSRRCSRTWSSSRSISRTLELCFLRWEVLTIRYKELEITILQAMLVSRMESTLPRTLNNVSRVVRVTASLTTRRTYRLWVAWSWIWVRATPKRKVKKISNYSKTRMQSKYIAEQLKNNHYQPTSSYPR